MSTTRDTCRSGMKPNSWEETSPNSKEKQLSPFTQPTINIKKRDIAWAEVAARVAAAVVPGSTNERAGHSSRGKVAQGTGCWTQAPGTPANDSIIPVTVSLTEVAQRKCTSAGHWEGRTLAEGLAGGWTNYTPCLIPEIRILMDKLYAKSKEDAQAAGSSSAMQSSVNPLDKLH
ncbi:hypothetical protein O3P69_013766 [Scylla paramamosain]|uniref:Uncharacterized protein n=1 Tax=Scylla paramamosain TaxID=85552 RepID=A0AAW0SRI9_SCYPA